MCRTFLGAFVGLMLGAILGCALAFALYRITPSQTIMKWLPIQGGAAQSSSTSVLIDISGPIDLATPTPVLWNVPSQEEQERSNLNAFLFHGILFGGGFAAFVGALAGAAGVLQKSLQESNRKQVLMDRCVRI
ncbi:MAG: hypothetical protein L0215_10065 [Gemmataceae bacterium]|nr:hypothetical protein [Gemmataceae bacterium]